MRKNPDKLRPRPIGTEAAQAIEDYLAIPDIHDVQREKPGGFITLSIALITTVLEAIFLYAAVTGFITPLFGLMLHSAVVVLLAICVRFMERGSEGRFILLLFISVIVTGPFGSAGVALSILIYLWCSRRALVFDEWFNSIFPKQLETISQRVNDDILIGRDESSLTYSVIPFMDVLSFGNEVQKRQALSKATANFHPNFAPLFRKGLTDNSNTIRVLAATGIGRVESHFLKRMMQLTEVRNMHPKDPLVVWALAEHYDNYAFTGLLDFDREQLNRQKALEYYHEYLQLRPAEIEPRNHIGRILMRNKEFEKACEWFRQCIASGYTSPSMSQWYSEALFACGRYEDLRTYRASLPPVSKQDVPLNSTLGDALALWSKK